MNWPYDSSVGVTAPEQFLIKDFVLLAASVLVLGDALTRSEAQQFMAREAGDTQVARACPSQASMKLYCLCHAMSLLQDNQVVDGEVTQNLLTSSRPSDA